MSTPIVCSNRMIAVEIDSCLNRQTGQLVMTHGIYVINRTNTEITI